MTPFSKLCNHKMALIVVGRENIYWILDTQVKSLLKVVFFAEIVQFFLIFTTYSFAFNFSNKVGGREGGMPSVL